MAKLGLNVVACDITPVVIKNLNRYKEELNLKNLTIIVSKAEEIPVPDKSFDFVVANAVLEHIPNEDAAVTEWKRILKPNGKIFITVPLKFRYIWPFLWPINYIYDKRIGHLRRYNLRDLEKVFLMKMSKVYYTGHLIKVLGFAMSLLFPSKSLLEYIEKVDAKLITERYGASNISVILEQK